MITSAGIYIKLMCFKQSILVIHDKTTNFDVKISGFWVLANMHSINLTHTHTKKNLQQNHRVNTGHN